MAKATDPKVFSEASGSSGSEPAHKGDASAGNRLLNADELVTPRMKAEQIVVSNLNHAAGAISYILQLRDPEHMATAVAAKVQASLAQYLIECAQNIGAANGGKQALQLPAAGVQSGSLAVLLAQRMSAKRNAQSVVQRRIVEVVQPTAAEYNAADGVAADGGSDAANGGSGQIDTP